MPKSAKKRKAKAADFSKTRLKLGKGKQVASNAVDTSFKARSIALPTQSIALEKDSDVPTTKRRLSFEDLISQLKHYSASTRKDAIIGMRELLEGHWELLDFCLTPLINACVRLIGDEDTSVRKALLGFLSWLLPRIPSEDLLPHSPMLLLFTTSAQTHIFPEIRVHAVRFLDLFLECIPSAVIDGWNGAQEGHGSRVLEGYLGILNAGTKFGEHDGPATATSTASVVLTPASKLVILQSLATFLECALTKGASSKRKSTPFDPFPTWYMEKSFSSPEAFHTFEDLLQHKSGKSSQYPARGWKTEVEPEDDIDDFFHAYSLAGPSSYNHLSLQELMDVTGSAEDALESYSTEETEVAFIFHLARTLHSTLVATFLDNAPSVLSPNASPSETEVQLVMSVAKIVRSLYGKILQTSQHISQSHVENLESILGYMAPYFPFRANHRDIKLEQEFQELNLIYCELTSLLVIAFPTQVPSESRKGKSRPTSRATSLRNITKEGLVTQASAVSKYIVQLLRGEEGGSSQIAHSLSAAVYTGLLPTIWALLSNPIANDPTMTSEVLSEIVEHAVKMSSKSSAKRMTIEFVSRLVLIDTEPQYRGIFRFGRSTEEDKKFENWLTHLPQTMWELGAGDLPATETILIALLRILQRKSRLINNDTIASLRARLIPYFSIKHAVRGQLPGPYCKLPVSTVARHLALDLAWWILAVGGRQGEQAEGLSTAVTVAVAGTGEESYWEHLKSYTTL